MSVGPMDDFNRVGNPLMSCCSPYGEPKRKPAPVRLTYDEFIAAEEHGAKLFKLRPNVSGQQMTEQDDVSWWVWRAIESAVLRKNGWGE